MAVTAISYGLCGALGVAGYPQNTNENIMLNLPSGVAVSILLISMALSIILSIPVVIWTMRESLDQLGLSAYRRLRRKNGSSDNNDEPNERIRFVGETLFLIGLSLAIALGIPSFATILGLSGAVTKMIICYLLPTIFFLKLAKTEYRKAYTVMAWCLLFFGIITGIISTVITIREYVLSLNPPDISSSTNNTLTNTTII